MASDYQNKESSAECEVALCVLAYFHGDRAICYETFNGRQRIVDEWRIQKLTPEYNNLVCSIKQFQKFRQKATENNSDLKTWSVGSPFVHVCYGSAEGRRIRYTPKTPPTTGEAEYNPVKKQTAGLIVEGGYERNPPPGYDEVKEHAKESGYMIGGLVGIAIVAAIFSYFD